MTCLWKMVELFYMLSFINKNVQNCGLQCTSTLRVMSCFRLTSSPETSPSPFPSNISRRFLLPKHKPRYHSVPSRPCASGPTQLPPLGPLALPPSPPPSPPPLLAAAAAAPVSHTSSSPSASSRSSSAPVRAQALHPTAPSRPHLACASPSPSSSRPSPSSLPSPHAPPPRPPRLAPWRRAACAGSSSRASRQRGRARPCGGASGTALASTRF